MSNAVTTSAPASFTAASQTDHAAFLLRVTMGAMFLVHAWLKIVVFTPAGTAQFFESIGLPGGLAYVVIAMELGGGVALLAGLWTRLVALALIPILLGTIVTIHGAAGFVFSNPGGGWEFPAFWSVALAVQALLGGGSLAVTKSRA
jgi:putative oxidoreductase